MYFTPLDCQPIYEAIAAWVGNEFAELDEVFRRCCLEFCELSRFSFPVKSEKEKKRCRCLSFDPFEKNRPALLAFLWYCFDQGCTDWRKFLGALPSLNLAVYFWPQRLSKCCIFWAPKLRLCSRDKTFIKLQNVGPLGILQTKNVQKISQNIYNHGNPSPSPVNHPHRRGPKQWHKFHESVSVPLLFWNRNYEYGIEIYIC